MSEQSTNFRNPTAAPSLHIVSLIVHVRPQKLAVVSRWIDDRAELQIHLGNGDGKLVVVLETRDHFQVNETIETIKDQPGVLNVVMVYHEELALADADDVLVEIPEARSPEQPIKIVGDR